MNNKKRTPGKRKQPCGMRKVIGSSHTSINDHGDSAQGEDGFSAWCAASKIRRGRLKARESVSLSSMDLAVLDRPKDRERLSCLRVWVALRLSAYDCLPMRSCQVSEPTCRSRARRMDPSGSGRAVVRENPNGWSGWAKGQVEREIVEAAPGISGSGWWVHMRRQTHLVA